MKNLHAEAPKAHAVGHLCGLLGRTKQAYYKTNEESLMRKLAQAELVTQYVKEIRRLDPGIGGVKLWHMYQKAFGQAIGRDRFMEILDTHGLKLRRAESAANDRLHPRTAHIPQPDQADNPHNAEPDLGGRHHIHTDMAKRNRVPILLSLNDSGCLHGRSLRLERRSHPGDNIPD